MARLQIKRQIHQMDLTPRSPTKPLRITLPPFTAIFLLDNPTGELLTHHRSKTRKQDQHLGDDLVVEDDFSVERGLSGGEAFFCREFLRLSDMFNCFAEVFFSRLVSLSGEVFLDFFGADFSEELAGLPLFLAKYV